MLDLNRCILYYSPVGLSKENTDLINIIHAVWSESSFYGHRKLTIALQNSGLTVNHIKELYD